MLFLTESGPQIGYIRIEISRARRKQYFFDKHVKTIENAAEEQRECADSVGAGGSSAAVRDNCHCREVAEISATNRGRRRI